jgi:hypothetical protein
MIRAIAKWWAKLAYTFKEEVDAALKDLNASAAQFRAGERRKEITAPRLHRTQESAGLPHIKQDDISQ